MINIPFILTLYAGFTHAFETDHILAVSNIVTNRNKSSKALKDGFYWGLGHSSMILIVGIIILLMKFNFSESIFRFFEVIVGILLIILGAYRILKWYKGKKISVKVHIHGAGSIHSESHLPAFLIGLIHGLAGSGALILIVMGESQSVGYGLLYLFLFGLGSVTGMMVAAGTFSLPFNKKLLSSHFFQMIMIFISSILCISYGSIVIIENIK